MKSIHAHGLVVPAICWLVCACGATERTRSGSGNEAGGGAAAGSDGPATPGASSGTAATEGLSAADAMALFAQAPHCGVSTRYELDGSIDGGTVHDGPDDFVGGFTNGDSGSFASPGVGVPPRPGRVAVAFEWKQGLINGQASTISSGTIIVPLGQPRAGETLCIKRGVVGFPQGGADESNFKFWLRAARLGADCGGAEVPIDLHGCMN
jgi:hypothetical protein